MAKKTAAEKSLASAQKAANKIGDFKYNDKGKQLSTYNSLNADYTNWLKNSTANGFNAYKTGGIYANVANVDELFDQIMNQEKFSYDPQTDQLFQMYKKQYDAQGTRAMKNAMGVGTAYSGGYNSSAAQTAAQSTYNSYLSALNDKVSETYQNALGMYKQNQQNLLDRYNIASDMNNASNQAYWSQLNAKQAAVQSAYQAFNDERGFQFGKYSDNRQAALTRLGQAQDLVNWEKGFNQDNKWAKKNYELSKKAYTG